MALRAYVDSSALLAIAFGESQGKAAAAAIAASDEIYSSLLLEAEVRSAAAREGVPLVVVEPLLAAVSWVCPDRRLTSEVDAALAAGRLPGADIHHLACALYLSPQPATLAFLTLDARQRGVAIRMGFAVPLAGRRRT